MPGVGGVGADIEVKYIYIFYLMRLSTLTTILKYGNCCVVQSLGACCSGSHLMTIKVANQETRKS